jgi:hypothetical protein
MTHDPKHPAEPPLGAALEIRDMSDTGPSARVYVHEQCGGSTAITDGHFYWAANPLRYSSGGSICAECGLAMDSDLRWVDTGETLARFRSRMWRHTPPWVKLLHYLVLPAVVGAIVLVVAPPAANIPRLTSNLIVFGLGFLAMLVLLSITPLAGILPAIAGLTYHKYR